MEDQPSNRPISDGEEKLSDCQNGTSKEKKKGEFSIESILLAKSNSTGMIEVNGFESFLFCGTILRLFPWINVVLKKGGIAFNFLVHF